MLARCLLRRIDWQEASAVSLEADVHGSCRLQRGVTLERWNHGRCVLDETVSRDEGDRARQPAPGVMRATCRPTRDIQSERNERCNMPSIRVYRRTPL